MTANNSPDIGHGTVIRVAATMAATTATVALGRVRSLNPPPYARDAVDVTSMESAELTREFIPGLIDRGEVTVELIWVPGDATDDILRAMLTEREPRLFEIAFPQIVSPVPTCSFRGFVTAFDPTVELEGEMTASVTMKVTGIPTWTGV